MTELVKFTSVDGKPVMVRKSEVSAYTPYYDQTTLLRLNGSNANYVVSHAFEEVDSMLREHNNEQAVDREVSGDPAGRRAEAKLASYEFAANMCGDRKVLKLTAAEAVDALRGLLNAEPDGEEPDDDAPGEAPDAGRVALADMYAVAGLPWPGHDPGDPAEVYDQVRKLRDECERAADREVSGKRTDDSDAEEGEEVSDLNTCPGCGGPADNGHDRTCPPMPYYCKKCQANKREAVNEWPAEIVDVVTAWENPLPLSASDRQERLNSAVRLLVMAIRLGRLKPPVKEDKIMSSEHFCAKCGARGCLNNPQIRRVVEAAETLEICVRDYANDEDGVPVDMLDYADNLRDALRNLGRWERE